MAAKNILLIEPKYKNKYPPLGLMKIATYHKMLGDQVTFYKGDLKEFVLDIVCDKCTEQLLCIDPSIQWLNKRLLIKEFIKRKNNLLLNDIELITLDNAPLIKNALIYFREYFLKQNYKNEPLFDRVYVTTLFTFDWKAVIDAILFVKLLTKDVRVGGIMASLLPDKIEATTGIKPTVGLLDKPGILDDNDIVIDDLPLDYSILDEIDYKYPTDSAYFGMMTKGCTRKCPFCSVPKLEPVYIPKLKNNNRFSKVKELYGDQRNLLLMDNNILASPNLPEIIQEIKDLGFYKGAIYIEPNQLDIAITNLIAGINNKAYTRRAYRLIHDLFKRTRSKNREIYYSALAEHNLLQPETATKEQLISVYPKIKDIYEKYRYKQPKQRFVDFNQGTDCRYITEDIVKLISEIPIRPLRIAFDYFGLKEQYIKAIKLAAKYDIKELSNYILYNFHDTPDELYKRLKINQELSAEYNLHIYSFPMKYVPLEPGGRDHIGKHWNRKFIRAIQSIINVTKGIVAPSRNTTQGDFFETAFGKNLEEFNEILYMPENYIVYRKLFEEELGYTEVWKNDFRNLNEQEIEIIKPIIEENDFSSLKPSIDNKKILRVLMHYTISKDIANSIARKDQNYEQLKKQTDKLIKQDNLLNLTLTYDYS
ncbi:hypothetical protein [Methylovulum psychrotolerans]|uniref:hypothetical protein n=1 Tax=Methylovulum psychrotolerans TaxID=1704499 RepID=UPI0018DF7D70|nr:hypothetical protein [Methylovulum psychrotolerans]